MNARFIATPAAKRAIPSASTSGATVGAGSSIASSSRAFRPFDREYADRCLSAATKSYTFLVAHQEDHPADLSAFRTGGYQAGEKDARIWAAAEMWETTGAVDALSDFEARARVAEARFDENFDWGNPRNFGYFAYLLSARGGRDSALVAKLRA